jgi:hypothetical protein
MPGPARHESGRAYSAPTAPSAPCSPQGPRHGSGRVYSSLSGPSAPCSTVTLPRCFIDASAWPIRANNGLKRSPPVARFLRDFARLTKHGASITPQLCSPDRRAPTPEGCSISSIGPPLARPPVHPSQKLITLTPSGPQLSHGVVPLLSFSVSPSLSFSTSVCADSRAHAGALAARHVPLLPRRQWPRGRPCSPHLHGQCAPLMHVHGQCAPLMPPHGQCVPLMHLRGPFCSIPSRGCAGTTRRSGGLSGGSPNTRRSVGSLSVAATTSMTRLV